MRPEACTTSNNQIISGFLGMIFGFFAVLFGASLVVPSTLMKLIKRMKKGGKEQ
jgi:ascorbate-specific PTS system EIIC-type component UlaA